MFQLTEGDVSNFCKQAGIDSVNIDGITRALKSVFMKDAIPNAGVRPNSGYLYDNGPFSLIEGDIYSDAITTGGPLSSWIPTSAVTHRFERIKHLEWVAPNGFDGSQTYSEWLSGLTIPECGYGPSTSFNGFEYEVSGGSFSWTTSNMKVIPDGGLSYYRQNPRFTIRGLERQLLANDRDWAVARVLMAMVQHLDYVLTYGNRANSDMEWDGLDVVTRLGYVQARRVGTGVPHWANPVIINGVTLTTAPLLLRAIRQMIRRIFNRVDLHNKRIADGDIALYMAGTLWANLADAIASGAMYVLQNGTNGFTGQMNWADFDTMLRRVHNERTIEVDGVKVAILADNRIGINTRLDPTGANTPAIASPVWALTKRISGDTILEQQYIDFGAMDYPTNGNEDVFNLQGGVVRAGWVTEANKCFYYYGEMAGRLVNRAAQYQGRIDNVVIPSLIDNENESPTFTSPDFYPFTGQGGRGVARLSPN